MPKKSKTPGVRARGNSIQIDFRYKGIRCVETLKIPPTARNIKYATNKRGSILFEIATNQFNYAEHFPNSKKAFRFGNTRTIRITVEEYLLDYFNKKKDSLRKTTQYSYKRIIERDIVPDIGEIYISELNSQSINNWISSKNTSNKTKNNILTVLRKAIEEAYMDEMINENPMERVRPFTNNNSNPDPFSPHEINILLKKLPFEARMYFRFAFFTGLRTAELLGLKWEDIDIQNKTAYIQRTRIKNRFESTKNQRSRRKIFLLSEALAALDELKNNGVTSDELIFINPATNKEWSLDIISAIWRKSIKKTELRYRKPYQTRHTYASMMLSLGQSLGWLQDQMGHSSLQMLQERYARWIPEIGNTDDSKLNEKLKNNFK